MNQQGHDGFWTNMLQGPIVETNRGLREDRTPAPNPRVSDSLLEGKKAGAALLFSGVALALLGATFTAMGWQHYRSNPYFQWIQLLGPVLISVGGTFVLTSVCKFPIMSCCKHREEEAPVRPPIDQTTTVSCVSHPSLIHNPMVCLPPPYSFVTQEVHRTFEIQPGTSVNGFHAVRPPQDAGGEEDWSAHGAESERRRRRMEKTEDEDGSRPPAYEDIYPSYNRPNPS